MSDQPEPENPIDFLQLLFNVTGFVWGFLLGGATGYFGNWLWEKFRPRKSDGHLIIEADSTGNISFYGRMTADNKEQILKTLKASATPTGSPKLFGRASTGTATTQGSRDSTRLD